MPGRALARRMAAIILANASYERARNEPRNIPSDTDTSGAIANRPSQASARRRCADDPPV